MGPKMGQNRVKVGPSFDHFWPFGAILDPFWTPKRPREPQNAGGNRPKWAKRGSTGHKNVFWDRLRPFGYRFSAFPAETGNRKIFVILTILGHFWPFFGPFWAHFGPSKGSGSPKMQGGGGRNGPKGGQQAIKMCFGTV